MKTRFRCCNSTLLGVVAALAAFSAEVTAETATVRATGVVEYACEIALEGDPETKLSLTYDPEEREFAVIAVRCNDPEGFRFEIRTENDFMLRDADTRFEVPYRLRLTNSPDGRLDGVAEENGFTRVVEEFLESYAVGASVNVAFEMTEVRVVPGGVNFADEITFEITGL